MSSALGVSEAKILALPDYATSPLYGADRYLDKPFRLDALKQTVTEVIELIEAGEY